MLTQPIFEAFVPQMLNYESFGGVSFKKGCYPGQEVVARSQFRGTL
jgi:folate-binding protein YgfZ